MASLRAKIEYTVAGNADTKARSLLASDDGPMKVDTTHMVAEACPQGWPAPVGRVVRVHQHGLEYCTFANIIIADDLDRMHVRWHIQDKWWTSLCRAMETAGITFVVVE